MSFLSSQEASRPGIDGLADPERAIPSEGLSRRKRASTKVQVELVNVAKKLLTEDNPKNAPNFGLYLNNQLQNLSYDQRIYAEKLMLDVLFMARTNQLNTSSHIFTRPFSQITITSNEYSSSPIQYVNSPSPYAENGDDVLMTMRSLDDASVLIEGYGQAGYKVHSAKTFFSYKRGEFLRRSYERTGITGYITRTQLAIRFRNPILEMPISKEERAGSRVSLWMLFRNRGASSSEVGACIMEDLEQSGMSRAAIFNYLLTPAAVGGIGLVGSSGSVAGVQYRCTC
ncbi:hypothetical protein ACJJTC_016497 [Scirpophaga incertulas]